MAPRTCALCHKAKAMLKRPKTGQQICRECFFYVFETEVHNTITQSQLFRPGDRVAIGASGGKGAALSRSYPQWFVCWECKIDSTVLAYVMKTLNERYNYDLDLFLLSIDEGITGYRDDSLEVRNFIYAVLMSSSFDNLMQRNPDSKTKSAAVWYAAEDLILWRIVWVDYGSHRLACRKEE